MHPKLLQLQQSNPLKWCGPEVEGPRPKRGSGE